MKAASIARPMQEEIVNALHLGERNRASYLLSEFGIGSQALEAGAFIFILEYCARTPDPLFVMETWKLMQEKDIAFSGKCYFLTIRALCKGGYLKEAFKIVSNLGENSGENATLCMYNNLLEASIQMQSLNYANECLHSMELQVLGKNEMTYALLLKLAVLQQDRSAVYEIWKECIKCYSPSIITLRKFIWSFTELRDLESAYTTLQQMVALALQHNFHIIKTAEGKLSTSRLDIPTPCHDKLTWKQHTSNNFVGLSSVAEYNKKEDSNKSEQWGKIGMEAGEVKASVMSFSQKPFSRPVMKLLRWSFSDVIHTCASMQNVLLAEQLMSQGFRDGMEVLKVMQLKNMKPCDSTLAAISVSCSKALELDLAETFLDQISQCPHPYPYNAFLKACDTLDQPERAVRVLAKMKHSNLLPDIRTYELLFSLFANVNAPYEDGNMLSQLDASKRINAIEMAMVRDGIQHSHLSMKNLLKALGMEGMMKELIQYLCVAEHQFFHENSSTRIAIYNTVLHSLFEARQSDVAIEIFKRMISCGFPPNAATYNIMIQCCSIIKCYRSACALVSMMFREGFCLNEVTYTALIKTLLGLEDFDEALSLLDQGSSEGIQPDLVMYNTILQEASEKGRIDVIEFVVERMHQEKIQPDPSTCSHVFSAYVLNGFYSTAMEALQVLCLRMISEQDNILEENRLEYEDLIFREDLEPESEIIEVFKDSTNLAVALLYLRWCAISAFPISWSSNQSLWAKRLSRDYASRFTG